MQSMPLPLTNIKNEMTTKNNPGDCIAMINPYPALVKAANLEDFIVTFIRKTGSIGTRFKSY